MVKSFTPHERELVRKNLVRACKECWSRYGYQKTGVRELAQMAGISPAMFYHFYASKELLFLEAIQDNEKDMERILEENLTACPGKPGVAAALKEIVAYIVASPWIGQIRNDWAVISRKLPADFLETDFRKDTLRVASLASRHGMVMTRPVELVTAVLDLIFISATERFMPDDHGAAIDFVIDSVVENLFE